MKKILFLLAGVGCAAVVVALAMAKALEPPALPVPGSRDLVVRNVTLVEPGGRSLPGRSLRVEAGRIESLDAGDVPSSAPDLEGLHVAPGWIDLHVHYPPGVAVGNAKLWSLLFLAHGVTSVRETGSADGSIFAVRQAIERGETPGPRIFACGPMLDGDPPSFPSNRVLVSAEEARRAVAEVARAGADCIKVYNMLGAEVLAAIVDAAAERGLPVIGHVPHDSTLEEAGVVDAQHGTGAVLIDREKIGRFDFHWEDWRTVDDARIARVAEISIERGIAHTPTLVNGRMRRLLTDAAARDEAVRTDTGLRHLPRFWLDAWAALWSPPWEAGDAAGKAAVEHFRARQSALAGGLHAAGARVHAGTDTMMPFVAPGSSLHGEVEDLILAGISPEDAWRTATQGAGEALAEGLGRLEVGAPADLVFFRPGPPGSLPTPDRIEAVVADGRLYRKRDLDEALARYDAHFHGGFYEGVMGGVVRIARSRFAPEG